MNKLTILFESIEAAQIALATLQPMINIEIDFNALTFDTQDEELVNWLVQDPFCKAFEQSQVYLHPARIIKKSDQKSWVQASSF